MLALALLLAATVLSQDPPLTRAPDPRIQVHAYDPDQVVTVNVDYGFASVVELGEDERAENIIVGNSAVWQVTPNRQGDRIVVKPLPDAIPTNMIVMTGSRRYMFMLYPGGGEQSAFVTRFSYPGSGDAPAMPAVAATYDFRGNRSLYPTRMYHDGRRTVVTWPKDAALPAVFALAKGDKEQLVDGRMVGNDYVIEGSAQRYRFRRGDAVALAVVRPARKRR